jgi:hypothetical protein
MAYQRNYHSPGLILFYFAFFQQLLETNRQALTDLFVLLMEEREKREEELAKRLVR